MQRATSTPLPPSDNPNAPNVWICLRCESVGPARHAGGGSVIGVLLTFIGAVVTGSQMLAGIALSIAGLALALARGDVRMCAACSSRETIPVTSPRAQRTARPRDGVTA
jgi:hypothetical protein